MDSIAKTVHTSTPIPENEQAYEKRLPVFRFITERLVEIGEKIATLR